MYIQNTLEPYATLEHNGIQYGVCRGYNHISRYRKLRQLIHNPQITDMRFISLETPNPFESKCEIDYYVVPQSEEDRLDIIAYRFLGTANYAWVIACINDISDGYTVKAGQRIRIPKSITSLFNTGEVLSPVSPTTLNLGYE